MDRRDTDAMQLEQAERELIIRDRVAYARQVAIDPDFRSVDGQALPDRFYATAQRNVARGAWTQDVATAWLQRQIKARMLAQLTPTRNATELDRTDAVFHSVAKFALVAGPCLGALYLATDAANFALACGFAGAMLAFRLCAALLTREVF